MIELGPWMMLVGLGTFHGLNPGMGWLFAVALALQRQAQGEIWRALPPIALGHALSIGAFSLLILALQTSVPETSLRIGAATVIAGFAVFRIWRKRHLTWVGMQVGFRDLTLWSFLMATAHGAGLMLAPVLLGGGLICAPGEGAMWAGMLGDQLLASSTGVALAAVLVHSAAHLTISALLALLVFHVFGVRVLRQAWFNMDRVWIVALFVAAGSVALP
jgi:hypothetical protein